MPAWRDFTPTDPEGLRYFIKYQTDEMIKAGYFFTRTEEEAGIIFTEVMDRTMKELGEHIADCERGASL